MPIITLDLPPELEEMVNEEKKKPIYNGNRSAVVRTALVSFFDRIHTSKCEGE